MTKVLYKKLDENAQPPKRMHEGDAGFDVEAISAEYTGQTASYGIGLAFAVPKGHWLMAVPRSSVYKTGMTLSNGIGVIDSGYRGEVGAKFWRVTEKWAPYRIGDRIMQLILMPDRTDEVEFIEVAELPKSWDGRGVGGFGSTGTKEEAK